MEYSDDHTGGRNRKTPEKLILIVDCGMGNAAFLTRQAYASLRAAGLWIGPEELLHAFDDIGGTHRKVYMADYHQAVRELEHSEETVAAVLAKGEPGGRWSAFVLHKELEGLNPVVIPGISMASYLAAVTGISKDHAEILDLDQPGAGIVPAVRRHRTVFVPAGGPNAVEMSLKELTAAGEEGLEACIVEHPGMESEHIVHAKVREASRKSYPPGSALILTRREKDGVRQFGLADSEFIRSEKIPMTKSEIRALIVSRMALAEDAVVYDIGAGTGSVSVECALAAPYGRVYAVEKKEEGIRLIRANAEKFGISNLFPVQGTAPETLAHLPVPDAAFIGGSSGKLKDILQVLCSRNPKIRITVTAVTLETVTETAGWMEGKGMSPEITLLQTAVSRKAGSKHMLTARNPVYLISGRAEDTGGVG